MIGQIKKLWRYNLWAWEQVWPSLEILDDMSFKSERPLFWGSLHGLTVHCMEAERIWFRRTQGESPTTMADSPEFPTLEAVYASWQPLQGQWTAFIDSLDDRALQQPIPYKNTGGSPRELLLVDIIQHVVNHATEHRSQMTPVLFELGASTQPLDYMRYCLVN